MTWTHKNNFLLLIYFRRLYAALYKKEIKKSQSSLQKIKKMPKQIKP